MYDGIATMRSMQGKLAAAALEAVATGDQADSITA